MIALVNGERKTGVESLLERLRGGDVRALARAISLVENGAGEAEEMLLSIRREGGPKALRVGVTGAPGAGKSTLVDVLVRMAMAEGTSVGVVAVDPTSAVTGGALLGDRIRIQAAEGVYIRSMATRGEMGGVARAAGEVCEVMEVAGRELVLVETVGVGQDEIAVKDLVDVTVLVLVPGMGDEIQSMKAGVMEAADIYAVNKSDRGGADEVEAEIVAMQGLSERREGWTVPVVRCSALTGEGVKELMDAVKRCEAWKREHGVTREASRVKVKTRGVIRLDHLGVAVKSLDAARGFYEALGMTVDHEETVEHEQVRVAMLPVGASRVELLEATAEDSVIAKFVAKRGEGLHHIALEVDGVDAMFARMREAGVRLASESVRVGAGGHRYFFVHPESTGGVLVEIVGSDGKVH